MYYRLLGIAGTGVRSLLSHPLRSAAVVIAVVAVLLPYVAGLGISQGIQDEAEASIRFGADLYVSGVQGGERVPIPLAMQTELQAIEGITAVVPRIVGPIVLGRNRENAVLVGLPVEQFPAVVQCVEGRLPKPSSVNELVVGTDLARHLQLRTGALIPPFYRNPHGERISEVVGLFRSDVSLWQSRLILAPLETASAILDQPGLVDDFLVYCRPGYEGHVATEIREMTNVVEGHKKGDARPQVIARDDLMVLIPTGLMHREGIFNLHFTLAFAVGILVVVASSGVGFSERRREIGILKATGWQTDEILLRGIVESFLLSLAAASLALVLSYLWLKWLNGIWIAGIFLAGVDVVPTFQVPCRLTAIPTLLSFLIAFVMIMSGTLYSSWRAAVVAPIEAMR